MNLNSNFLIKDKLRIRPFLVSDRLSIRNLCADTAFMGEPAEKFLKSREVFADWATTYYTDYEPGAIFLAEYGGKAVGYVMGCVDEKNYSRIFLRKILPALLIKMLKALFFDRSAATFLYNAVKSFLKGEFNRPDFSGAYPAHLHINIDKEFRGLGIGSTLIGNCVTYLALHKARGVRLATISKRASEFFEKSGFSLLYRKRISYFDYIAPGKLYLSIYGKVL